MLNYHFQLQG
nr:unnamed protein product [Callosobruchus analis]